MTAPSGSPPNTSRPPARRNWKTRIGSFKFPGCGGVAPTPTNTPTPGPTATTRPCPPTRHATPNPNPPDFTLSVAPASRTIARRSSGTYTVNLASVNGFSGNVSLSVSGLPSRTSSSFSPNPVALASGGSGSSTLTVTVNRQATARYLYLDDHRHRRRKNAQPNGHARHPMMTGVARPLNADSPGKVPGLFCAGAMVPDQSGWRTAIDTPSRNGTITVAKSGCASRRPR